jgi:hypothetical protein
MGKGGICRRHLTRSNRFSINPGASQKNPVGIGEPLIERAFEEAFIKVLMKLVVLNVAFPFAPVGPDALGGAEQILGQLDSALARSGHESFVMACEGSVTEGILLATPKPSAYLDQTERRRIHEQYRYTLQTFVEKWPIDLIHMHGGDFYDYLPAPGVPVLVTLHLPVDRYPESIFHLDRPQTFLQCVSAEQRKRCPTCANLLPEIENDLASEHFFNPHVIDKYFSIYEQLVEEARALDANALEYTEGQFVGESVHA